MGRLVTPKFQVSSTSVSRTLKNGCKFFFFYYSPLVLWLKTIFVSVYTNPLFILFLFFFFCFRFYFFKNFFLCLVFLFIHYSSVTSYLDLVAWFLNSLGELNLVRR